MPDELELLEKFLDRYLDDELSPKEPGSHCKSKAMETSPAFFVRFTIEFSFQSWEFEVDSNVVLCIARGIPVVFFGPDFGRSFGFKIGSPSLEIYNC